MQLLRTSEPSSDSRDHRGSPGRALPGLRCTPAAPTKTRLPSGARGLVERGIQGQDLVESGDLKHPQDGAACAYDPELPIHLSNSLERRYEYAKTCGIHERDPLEIHHESGLLLIEEEADRALQLRSGVGVDLALDLEDALRSLGPSPHVHY